MHQMFCSLLNVTRFEHGCGGVSIRLVANILGTYGLFWYRACLVRRVCGIPVRILPVALPVNGVVTQVCCVCIALPVDGGVSHRRCGIGAARRPLPTAACWAVHTVSYRASITRALPYTCFLVVLACDAG